MIIADYHTHTRYSHGKGTPEQNVQAAIACGLRRIAISEHGPAHMFFGVRGEKLRALRREVDDLARRYAGDIEVLMGMECNLTAFGQCDAPKDRSMFDVLLLGFHKGIMPRDWCVACCSMEALGLARPNPVQTAKALLAAGEAYRIDIFSHPSLYTAADIGTLAAGARELGIALEINGARVTMRDDQLRTAKEKGAKLIIGSDAHTPQRVGDFSLALAAAERAGVLDCVENWE